MYRSGSSTRVSDEFFSNPSSADAELQQQQQQLLLPTYNPDSHLAKKEKTRLRSAEAAVHLIPILLIICAVILWFFSAPGRYLGRKRLRIETIISVKRIARTVNADSTRSPID